MDGGWFDGLTTSGLGAYSWRIVTAFRLLRDAGTPGRRDAGALDPRLRGDDGLLGGDFRLRRDCPAWCRWGSGGWIPACAGMTDCLRGNDGLLGGESG